MQPTLILYLALMLLADVEKPDMFNCPGPKVYQVSTLQQYIEGEIGFQWIKYGFYLHDVIWNQSSQLLLFYKNLIDLYDLYVSFLFF